MAIRRSTKLINDLTRGYGVRELLRDGRIFVYSGAQPAEADDAPSGTNLLTFTVGGNPFTDATQSYAQIAIGGAATGEITEVTVGGMGFNLLSGDVAFTSSATTTAGLIADNINAKQNPLNITAEASTTYVLLKCPHWMGIDANGLTFATSTSGNLTATTSGVFANGVTALNGINFGETISAGTLTKDSSTWQGTGLATGTAGWFRFVPTGSTVDGIANEDIRFDGTVGTSNSDLIMSTTSIETGAVHTINSASITEAG